MSDVAIVHKHYPVRGGAEVVADELARTFDAPVYTGIANPGKASDDVEVRELFASSRLSPILRKPSMPWQAIRDAYYYFNWDYCPELADHEVLVESGMAPFWYTPEPEQTVVRYVHSTPRMPYDRYQDVGRSRLVRAYSRVVRLLLEPTISYADQYVANSEAVARRLEVYFDVDREDVEVVYPPVDITGLRPTESRGDYYLGLSRLHRGKGFDEVIRAFGEHHRDKTLRIAGDGPDRKRLERLAHGYANVELLGYVSETSKRELLEDARALIYNAHHEDFGMVPIEAFAAGTPVIGVLEGFTKYQVADAWSGVTYERGIDELAAAIERFEAIGAAASPSALAEIAEQCHPEHFRERMQTVVDRARSSAVVAPETWGGLEQRGEWDEFRVPAGRSGREDDD